jgi:DNA-binding transcriptional MerR regulator
MAEPEPLRRIRKSEAAFRTISEVATDLDVPQHVLRFWETKFPQVRPLKRGGGRRYYRPEDVVLLKRVRDLLYGEGYTIKGVQRLLKDQPREFGRESAEDVEEARPARPHFVIAEPRGPEVHTGPTLTVSVPAPVASEPKGLPPDVKVELKALLDELVAIKALLKA